jgi:hypothetical protein
MMSMLIRLYPRAWRERYGEELSLLLEDRPPGPFDALDLFLGALDAHIHSVGARGAALTSTPPAARLGAGAAVAGGALWMLTLSMAVREEPGLMDLVMLLVSLTLSMFVVALAALSAVQSKSHPLLVWISFLLPAVGVVLLLCGSVAEVAVGDRPLVGDLTPYAFWMAGVVFALGGSLLFGIISTVAGGLTRWTAALLSMGALLQLVTLFATDHARDEWLMFAGAVAFGLSWILVGVGASRAERTRGIGQAT